MTRMSFALTFGILIVTSTATSAMAAEFPDHTIVVSDNWCAPNNDGACNTCNFGHVVVAATCNGTYCDNMVYQCASPPSVMGGSTVIGGSNFIANVNEPSLNYGWADGGKGAGSINAICPAGYAMTGMISTGSNSASIRTYCAYITRLAGWAGITPVVKKSSTSISDEAPYHLTYTTTYWLAGASCNGTDCDNMFYWYADFY